PHKFFQSESGEKIRKYLYNNNAVDTIVNFTTNQVFSNATTYTCLLFLSKKEKNNILYKQFSLNDDYTNLSNIEYDKFDYSILNNNSWNFNNSDVQCILNKIDNQELLFSEITYKIFKGSSTGNDNIYLFDILEENQNTYIVKSNISEEKEELEKDLLVPFLYGESIRRYQDLKAAKYLLLPYVKNKDDDNMSLIDIKELKIKYPLTYRYLNKYKSVLLTRKIKMNDNDYYKYSALRSINYYERKKIMIPDMLVSLRISYDFEGCFYHGPSIHSIIFNEKINNLNEMYFYAILNSKIFWFFVSNTSTALRGNAYRLTPEFISPFKFPNIDLNNKQDKEMHDKMAALVDSIISLNKKLASEKNPNSINMLNRQINAVDKQIDSLVYKLYNLSDEEVKIIEGE
ncbi:TaqI-like C-terminal specificity domain-containing protein, partial [Brachyspira catarrhinii]